MEYAILTFETKAGDADGQILTASGYRDLKAVRRLLEERGRGCYPHVLIVASDGRQCALTLQAGPSKTYIFTNDKDAYTFEDWDRQELKS